MLLESRLYAGCRGGRRVFGGTACRRPHIWVAGTATLPARFLCHAPEASIQPRDFFISSITHRLRFPAFAAVNHAFEFLDLVAEQGGFFKLQILGGFEHFAFQFLIVSVKSTSTPRVAQNGVGFFAVRFVSRQAFLDGAAHAARRDVVLLVVGDLSLAAVFGDGQKFLDAVGHHVGVKNHLAVEMPRGAAGGLNQTRFAAQKTFLVGVENRHERNFRQIQPFAQQIDADEHVEFALAQRAQNFDALNGVNFAVEILDVDADAAQVIGQFLGGALGERRHEYALLRVGAFAAFLDEIVNLALERLERDFRVNQAGRAHDQFHDAGLFVAAEASRLWSNSFEE